MKLFRSLPVLATILCALPAFAQNASLQRQETKQEQIRTAAPDATTTANTKIITAHTGQKAVVVRKNDEGTYIIKSLEE